MGKFNNIKITYNCDLQDQALEKVFSAWEPYPSFFDRKGFFDSWSNEYPFYVVKRFSKHHIVVRRRGDRRWLSPMVDVEYDQEQKILNLRITTRKGAYVYLLLPVLYFLFFRDAMLDLPKNGPGFFIGFVVGVLVIVSMIFMIPISEKGALQKSVEEQLGLARIKFSRLSK
ncbi:MAG: hypothetical protein AAFZ63_27115 [Bacteroidota bacterium]